MAPIGEHCGTTMHQRTLLIKSSVLGSRARPSHPPGDRLVKADIQARQSLGRDQRFGTIPRHVGVRSRINQDRRPLAGSPRDSGHPARITQSPPSRSPHHPICRRRISKPNGPIPVHTILNLIILMGTRIEKRGPRWSRPVGCRGSVAGDAPLWRGLAEGSHIRLGESMVSRPGSPTDPVRIARDLL